MARDGKSPPLCRSKAVEVAPKHWKTNDRAPILGVRKPGEGAGRVKERLLLAGWVRWGLRSWTRRADARAAAGICPGWAVEAGAKMSCKCHRKKTQAKGSLGC